MKPAHRFVLCLLLPALLLLPIMAASRALAADSGPGPVAPKPLFRDPVYDGAADPVLVWDRAERKWLMFYTNRRANVPDTPGVSWVHGTPVGIAESADGGATWKYRGTAKIEYGKPDYTFWAPEVVYRDGVYHMFLAVVPGTFTDWNHPRDIVHLTSMDLIHWKYQSTLKLASDRVIDPCVLQLPNGTWRMWYNNERDHKSTYYADSPDLSTWQDGGKTVGDKSGEGPVAFRWKGYYWLIVDVWQGLAVYRSDDALHWTRQAGNLLAGAGHGADDGAKGDHADVVVSGDRAFLFYFTQFNRRSSIQVVEMALKDGVITCDRDSPTHIHLLPPTETTQK